MAKYNVSLVFSADWGVEVEANSPYEAMEKAYNSPEASPSLCHQCANEVNLGDCIRAIVHDEDWNEVMDDGHEANRIVSLENRIAELEQEVQTLSDALGEKNQQP